MKPTAAITKKSLSTTISLIFLDIIQNARANNIPPTDLLIEKITERTIPNTNGFCSINGLNTEKSAF
jgi:hypothetical protein